MSALYPTRPGTRQAQGAAMTAASAPSPRSIICEHCAAVTVAACDCLGYRYLCARKLQAQVAEALQRHPDYSNRKIAKMIGCSEFPVRKMRAELEESGAIEIATEREGIDGKNYPNRYGDVTPMPFEPGEAQFDAQVKTTAAMMRNVNDNEAAIFEEMQRSDAALRACVDAYFPSFREKRRRKRPRPTTQQRRERQRKWAMFFGLIQPKRFAKGALAIYEEFKIKMGTWHGFGDPYYNIVTLKRIRERIADYTGRLEDGVVLIIT
jgi:DNA-binding Lrp family transcriptional regulator